MDLEGKDVLVLIGPSRAGKGTLLTALKGYKMKYFQKGEDEKVYEGGFNEETVATESYIAPVDENEEPIQVDLMSHSFNSHTIEPSIVHGPGNYSESFSRLDGMYLVDFPGMFDSRGPAIDIAIDMALREIL